MNLKKYQPILQTGILSFLVYGIHKLFFYLNNTNPKFQNFQYSNDLVLVFFTVCSILISISLILVKNRNINNVGFAFLWLTFIKMGLSYAFFSPLLHSEPINGSAEKTNFLIVFLLFLTIETVAATRILNNKQ